MNNPIKKISFECDLGDTEIPFLLSNDLRLDIGNWQVALDSVAFHGSPNNSQDRIEKNYVFKFASSIVTDYKREGGKYMLNYTSLGRFAYSNSLTPENPSTQVLKEFVVPKWYIINNYQSENICFFLEVWPKVLQVARKSSPNVFPSGQTRALFEVLLQRIN